MTTEVIIPDSAIDAESPIPGSVLAALRNNPYALFEGNSATKLARTAFPSGAGVPASFFVDATLGDYTERETGRLESRELSATKVLEWYISRPGSYRVVTRGATRDAGGWLATWRVYKNGSAAGTERSSSSVVGTTYTDDLSGLIVGDLVQVYAHTNQVLHPAYVYAALCCSNPMTPGAHYNYSALASALLVAV